MHKMEMKKHIVKIWQQNKLCLVLLLLTLFLWLVSLNPWQVMNRIVYHVIPTGVITRQMILDDAGHLKDYDVLLTGNIVSTDDDAWYDLTFERYQLNPEEIKEITVVVNNTSDYGQTMEVYAVDGKIRGTTRSLKIGENQIPLDFLLETDTQLRLDFTTETGTELDIEQIIINDSRYFVDPIVTALQRMCLAILLFVVLWKVQDWFTSKDTP